MSPAARVEGPGDRALKPEQRLEERSPGWARPSGPGPRCRVWWTAGCRRPGLLPPRKPSGPAAAGSRPPASAEPPAPAFVSDLWRTKPPLVCCRIRVPQDFPTLPPPCSPPGHPEAAAEASSPKSRRSVATPTPPPGSGRLPRARPVPPPPPQAGARPRGRSAAAGLGGGWEGLGGRQAGPLEAWRGCPGVAPASKKPPQSRRRHCTVSRGRRLGDGD